MTVNYETGEIVGPGIRIEDVIVGERARKDYGDLTSLMDSIREHGLLQPIGLLPGNRLLFGGRRLEACKRLGWESIPVVYPETQQDALSLLKAERDENTCRKDMTYSEKVAIADRIAEMERPKARERQVAHLRRGDESPSGPTDPNGDEPYRRSTDVAAEAVGMSRKTYERAKLVSDASDNPNVPEEVRDVARQARDEMDSGTLSVKAAQHKVNAALGRSAESTAPADKPTVERAKPAKAATPRGNEKTPEAIQARADRIADMAERGYTSEQIADDIGVHAATVKNTASKFGIEIPADKVMARTRRIDSNRIVRELVLSLEGSRSSLQLVNYDHLNLEEAEHWVSSLTESLSALRKLRDQIKERTQ